MNDVDLDRRMVFGMGAAAVGATAMIAMPARAEGKASGYEPAMEPADEWMDKPGTKHRAIFDTTEAKAAAPGAGYAFNFIHVNEAEYGVTPDQLAVILVLRHGSTVYGYNDAIWQKYGAHIAKALEFDDDQAADAAKGNPLLAPPEGEPMKGFEWAYGAPLALLAKNGGMMAVCGLATKGVAMQLARATDGDAAAVEAELRANLAPGARIVPAGVVAINRAQERGYSFSYVG